MKSKEEIIIVNAFLDNDEKIDLAIECLKQLKKTDIEIMMVSHYNIPQQVRHYLDYYLYDKNNTFLTETADYVWWRNEDIHFRVRSFFAKHSYAALTSLRNGVMFSKSIGKTFFHHIEYDNILSDKDIEVLKNLKTNLNGHYGYIDTYRMSELNEGVSMLYLSSYVENFLSIVDIPTDKKEYLEWMHKNTGAIGSEMFLYSKLKLFLESYITGVRKGDRISFFSDVNTKIACSYLIEKNDLNHISDITYYKKDKNKTYFVFINRSNNLLKLKINEQESVICHNCIFYIKLTDKDDNIYYTLINEKTKNMQKFHIKKSEILKDKRHDEFIEFL
jgi:hypothetical protein